MHELPSDGNIWNVLSSSELLENGKKKQHGTRFGMKTLCKMSKLKSFQRRCCVMLTQVNFIDEIETNNKYPYFILKQGSMIEEESNTRTLNGG